MKCLNVSFWKPSSIKKDKPLPSCLYRKASSTNSLHIGNWGDVKCLKQSHSLDLMDYALCLSSVMTPNCDVKGRIYLVSHLSHKKVEIVSLMFNTNSIVKEKSRVWNVLFTMFPAIDIQYQAYMMHNTTHIPTHACTHSCIYMKLQGLSFHANAKVF